MSVTNWNPADKHADISLSNFNKTAAEVGANPRSVRSINPKSTGKWYFEVWLSSGTPGVGLAIGLGDNAFDLALPIYDTGQSAWCIDAAGDLYDNGTSIASSTALADSDIVGIAVDFDNGYMWVYVNNALVNGSTDPPTSANADFTTIAGTLYPCCSTEMSVNFLTGAWLADDQAYTPPTGFSAWDDGAVLPEIITSNANATETTTFTGSAYSITETASAAAVEAAAGTRIVTQTSTSSANATSTLTFRRGVTAGSTAAVSETVKGVAGVVMTIAESAAAVESVPRPKLTILAASSANAASTLLMRRGLTLVSTAGASNVASGPTAGLVTLTKTAAASETAALVMTASEAEEANATETVTGRRIVTAVVTDTAGSAAVAAPRNNALIGLMSEALATSLFTGSVAANIIVTDEAEAFDFVRLSDENLSQLWVNPMTGAAAQWTGLPVNSIIQHEGVILGATRYGIVTLENGIDDLDEAIDSEVLWDLDNFGSPQKKRMGSVYVSAQGGGPFTVRVINEQGRFDYSTRLPGTPKATNHRAIVGRGLESVYFRIGVLSSKDFGADHVIVEHEQVARRT
jgi:hypothetical protein